VGVIGPVDAVFTWVDGERLPGLDEWRDRLAGRLGPGDVTPNRWRDNGELRYALRSLEANAPWIRHVHLVTAGEVPSWLDPSAPGLRLVRHEQIFPDPAVLPTFNSAAIEAVVHRIPGLAEDFLNFNDDVLLGRPATPADFRNQAGGTRVHVEPWPLPRSLVADNVVGRMLAFNALRLGPPVRMLAHAPQLFSRDGLGRVWARFRPDLERTLGHRFRSTDDANIRFLHLNALLQEGPPHEAVENQGDTGLVRVGGPELLEALADLRTRRPLSFCLNDEVVDWERDGWMWTAVRAFLEERFPVPSRFEVAVDG